MTKGCDSSSTNGFMVCPNWLQAHAQELIMNATQGFYVIRVYNVLIVWRKNANYCIRVTKWELAIDFYVYDRKM